MAYFAKLDENNKVLKVESVHDNECKDENGVEQESKGQEFLRNLYKEPTAVWKQTSYNTEGGVHKLGGTPFRKNYAGSGSVYDEANDAFYKEHMEANDGTIYTKWVLNQTTFMWEPPVAYPETFDDGKQRDDGTPIRDHYDWNDSTGAWEKP